MTDYIFTLGLIPVQDWIAQARRSRDLRAGSVFLWHVMAKLLTRLTLNGELAGVEIWTPQATGEELGRLAGLPFRKREAGEGVGGPRGDLQSHHPNLVKHTNSQVTP